MFIIEIDSGYAEHDDLVADTYDAARVLLAQCADAEGLSVDAQHWTTAHDACVIAATGALVDSDDCPALRWSIRPANWASA